MKANGKNLIMFYYESHDYIDLYPEQHFRTDTKENMEAFIKHMREHWCSGTISDAKEVSPQKFFKARQSNYWRGYEEMLDNAALDCPQAWVNEYFFYVEHKNEDITELEKQYEQHIEDMIADYCSEEF